MPLSLLLLESLLRLIAIVVVVAVAVVVLLWSERLRLVGLLSVVVERLLLVGVAHCLLVTVDGRLVVATIDVVVAAGVRRMHDGGEVRQTYRLVVELQCKLDNVIKRTCTIGRVLGQLQLLHRNDVVQTVYKTLTQQLLPVPLAISTQSRFR